MDGLDTPLEVDTKIANVLLGLATEASSQRSLLAGTPASRRSRGPRPTRRCLIRHERRAASKTTLQSALDAILAELAALQLSGRGVVNAPTWAGLQLGVQSNVVRNLHLGASLSAALANGVSVPVDTSPTVVKFPGLAVLLMVSVLPVIPVAELSRPMLAAPLMLSELHDTAPVDNSAAPATVPAVSAAHHALW